MTDFTRIRAVKKSAQSRLMAIPGVHAVGIGAKYVGGQPTLEPAIIVFVVKKKPLSDLAANEVVPPEIDGVKTDIIETEEPTLHADDSSSYRPIKGGIQLQAGIQLNGNGTLGCIGITNDPDPKIVAITCQHVVTMWQGLPTNLTASVSPNQHVITFAGTNTPGSLVVLNLTVMPAGPGPSHDLDLFWVTTQADTPSSVAATVAAGITALANPAMTAASAGSQVTITWASGFIVLVPNCRVYDIRKPDPDADLRASITGTAITLSGRVSDDNYGIYTNVNPRERATYVRRICECRQWV